ncbi:MAG TPA: AsmA-like C-terminal region-containing protein, partial [Candidatus Acidoferrum sp.]|nr:AsmA-like C-terminal region-containing protein [Candidatus Acidoferrum sp.]
AQGKLATPLLLDLTKQQAQLPSIVGDLTVSGKDIPNKSLKATVQGGGRADWAARNANIDLAVKLDDSNIQTKLAVLHWSQPAVNFTFVADRLNVDRYLPPSQPAAASGGAAPGGGTPPEQPFDLSPLKTLDATGDVQIGALQVSNIKAERVALKLKANAGRLDISPMSANIYQGTLVGSAAVNANDNGFALKQKLASVSIGPLLHDAASKDLLEGKANLNLDVTTVGTTVSALKKALAGTASIAVRDGAIKGIDIPGTIRKAKGMLGSKTPLEEQAQSGVKTDFSELTASFTIKNGVAHNDDLQMKSPLLRLVGKGDINIGEGTMDYTTQTSIVATATGQGGKELADVAGLTVPVRVTGPLASPKYSVDVAALATGVAKGVLQHELERRLGGGSGSQPGGSGGPGDAIGNTLRGIFGKPKSK